MSSCQIVLLLNRATLVSFAVCLAAGCVEVAETTPDGGDSREPPPETKVAGPEVVADVSDSPGGDSAERDTDETTPADPAPSCQVGDRVGVCGHASACLAPLVGLAGFCAGSPIFRCCLDAWAECSADGVPGACMQDVGCLDPWTSHPGLCPGPADIRCCTAADHVDGCDPGASPLPNADAFSEPPGDPGCPAGMIDIAGAYCVDRYEASLVLRSDPTTTWSPYRNPKQTEVRAVSVAWAVPQGYINGVQASDACRDAGKRLCTSAEWLRACQGPSETTYPYGVAREPGVCNDARAVHPAVEYFGSAEAWVFGELDHPCINQLSAGLALTGEHVGCVSAEGAADMMGNLHEWVADDSGVFRGGFYVDTVINGAGCLYRTTAHGRPHWDYSTGFRCCADGLTRPEQPRTVRAKQLGDNMPRFAWIAHEDAERAPAGRSRWTYDIARLALIPFFVLLSGCDSDSPNACNEAFAKWCDKACECGGSECSVADNAGSSSTLSFDSRADCIALVSFGCSTGPEQSQIDYGACSTAMDTAQCTTVGDVMALASPQACQEPPATP